MTEDLVAVHLKAADPVQGDELSTDAISDALVDLRDQIRGAQHEPVRHGPRSRGRRRVVAAVAALAIVGTATGAAAAGGMFAHTGQQAEGGENGTGEYIRLDAPGAGDALRALGADIPLPPGSSFDDIEERLPHGPTQQATSGVLGMLESNAGCMWGTYWLKAQASGDVADLAKAQAGIDRLPTRPNLVDHSDPPGGGRRFWEDYAAAARSGDPQAFRDAGYTANCTDAGPGT